MATKFYEFHQNNSGGYYHVTDKVSEVVIIEAHSADEANEVAMTSAGIYFHGVRSGIDCECCGDRWHRVDEFDAMETLETQYPAIVYKINAYDVWTPEKV